MKKEENKTTKKILSLIRKMKKDKKRKKTLEQQDIKKYSMTQLDHVISKIKEQEFRYITICVILVLVITLSICFIVFSSIQKTVYDSTLKSGKLLISYKDVSGNIGNIINLNGTNTYNNYTKYEVTIINTSKETKEYVVKIVDDLEMAKIDGCVDKRISRKRIKYSYNDYIYPLTDEEVIITDVITPQGSVIYNFRIWVDGDFFTEADHFHAKLSVKQK